MGIGPAERGFADGLQWAAAPRWQLVKPCRNRARRTQGRGAPEHKAAISQWLASAVAQAVTEQPEGVVAGPAAAAAAQRQRQRPGTGNS